MTMDEQFALRLPVGTKTKCVELAKLMAANPTHPAMAASTASASYVARLALLRGLELLEAELRNPTLFGGGGRKSQSAKVAK